MEGIDVVVEGGVFVVEGGVLVVEEGMEGDRLVLELSFGIIVLDLAESILQLWDKCWDQQIQPYCSLCRMLRENSA